MSTTTPTPWVRVVIVNFNGGDLLARCVAGLAAQTDGAFEAVVVDNASTDGSVDNLVLPDARFRIARAGENLGFARGCNLGAAGAICDWLAMLNPDAVPARTWLAALRAATMRHGGTSMFGSTQLSAQAPDKLDGAGDNYSIFGIAWRGGFGGSASLVSGDIAVFSPCAAAALYCRDAFEAVGGFAEPFFCYLEDVDLGFRLRLAGHDAVQVADAVVDHAGSAITGRYSRFTIFHSTRNGIFLLVRCMPLPLLAIALPLYLLAQLYLGVRLHDRELAAARLGGVIGAMRALPRRLAERRAIRAQCRASMAEVARWLVWDPRKLSRRDICPLPLRGVRKGMQR